MADVLRWSQRAIDLADGDPSKGNFICWLPAGARPSRRGQLPVGAWVVPGGATTSARAMAMARRRRPRHLRRGRRLRVLHEQYRLGYCGPMVRRCARSRMPWTLAERSGDDFALVVAPDHAGRRAGAPPTPTRNATADAQLLARGPATCLLRRGHHLCDLPLVDVVLGAGERLGVEIATDAIAI